MLLEDRIRRISGWLGLITALIGGVVLDGWIGKVNPLGFLHLNAAPMKPGAAACLMLGGISLWLQLRKERGARLAGTLCAAAALLIALSSVARKWFGLDPGL